MGASGYAGVELLRLCAGHPEFEVAVATAGSHAGDQVARHTPSLAAAYPSLAYAPPDPTALDGVDVAFLALPHGESQRVVPDLADRVGVIVDLAADFRLHDAALYPVWYGKPHDAPELLGEFVTGLPELDRTALTGCTTDRGARLLSDRCAPRARPVGRGRACHNRVLRASARRGCGEWDLWSRARRRRSPPLRRRGRGFHRVLAARPPAHARDRARTRSGGVVHSPPRPDGPGHPRHLLRACRTGSKGAHHRIRSRRHGRALRGRTLRDRVAGTAFDQGNQRFQLRRGSPSGSIHAPVGSWRSARSTT